MEQTDEWLRKIVTEKSVTLSEFLDSKRAMITSSISDDAEKALTEIQAVILKLPKEFLSTEEVALLLGFFINSLDWGSLPSISTIHHLVTKSQKLPEHYEEMLIRAVYKERNLQSWPQKERVMLYEIFHWLLRNRAPILKSMGDDFLATFLKSVSGERDPRCLVHMFSVFLEVSANFQLGPFSEEMFETVVCYFPVDFKPNAGDTVTRDYLAATCASCLTASQSFAPWCLLFIDEKLNDDECGEQEYADILDLFMLAAKSFEAKSILKQVEPLVHGFRKLALDPQRNPEFHGKVLGALRALFAICAKNERIAEKVVKSVLEDSEPFVIQAEMGLTKLALNILQGAYECLTGALKEKVLRQVIAWILHLVNGDSVNVKNNKAEIVEESLQYLINWVKMAGKNQDFKSLEVFEASIFSSCSAAREWSPKSALVASYECAETYLQNESISAELIGICREHIESELCSPMEPSTFESLLTLVKKFSERCPEQTEEMLAKRTEWNTEKTLPILCAIGGSQRFWSLLKNVFPEELKLSEPSVERYVKMMETTSRKEPELFLKQFGALEQAVLQTENIGANGSLAMQSASGLLDPEEHKKFMERIVERFRMDSSLEAKFYLSFLQNKNSSQLMEMVELNFSERARRQFVFAACNRNAQQDAPERYSIALLKANFLRNSPGSLESLEHFLKSSEHKEHEEQFVSEFEYLCDFDSPDTDPERCHYEISSVLWRQRMFCQLVTAYSKLFFDVFAAKEVLIEVFPFLMKFANPLDANQLTRQFAALLPVVLFALRTGGGVTASLSSTIPMFLEVSGPLSAGDVHSVVGYLSMAIKSNFEDLNVLESSLTSLTTIAKKQKASVLLPEVSQVITVVNRLLGHKKRFLRVLAANVKNLWERKSAAAE